jgi:hypothetical protein
MARRKGSIATPITRIIVICRSTLSSALFRLWAPLRTSDKDAADGVVAALAKIVAALRQRCRQARIIVRGDSGFCREENMA